MYGGAKMEQELCQELIPLLTSEESSIAAAQAIRDRFKSKIGEVQ